MKPGKMPITDKEKRVQVHSRLSSDFLAAVPIKKRRFLFLENESLELELKSVGDSVEVNTVEGEFGDCESSFSKSGGNPAQVNSVIGENAYCEPCDLPSPTPTDCDMSDKKPESLKPEASILKSGGNPSQRDYVVGKDASSEPHEHPITLKSLKHESLPSFNDQGSKLNMEEKILINKCSSLPVIRNTVISSSLKTESKAPNEGIFLKQEELEPENLQSKSSDTKSEADFAHISLNRINWDLNTTMDAWENSSTDSLPNNGTADLGDIHNKGLDFGLKHISFREQTATDPISGSSRQQKNDNQLKSPNQGSSSVDSNSKASLDLQLKPSFLLNPCISSGERKSITETPILSLAPKPSLATVKSEPIDGVHKGTTKVQLGTRKSLHLNHVKSECCEEKEISKMTMSSNMKMTCVNISKPIKPELQEDQSNPSFASQSTIMNQNAGQNNAKASSVASVSTSEFITCTKRPYIPHNSSYLVGTTQAFGNVMSKSLAAHVNKTSSPLGACEPCSLPLATCHEPLISNGGGDISMEDAPEFVVQINPSNSHHSSNSSSLTDEVLRNSCGNSKVTGSDEVEGKVGMLSEIEEEPFRKGSENYEDDEVSAAALNKKLVVKSTNLTTSDNVPVLMPLSGDEKENKAEGSKELNVFRSKDSDGGLHENKAKPSSSAAGLGKKSTSKTIDRTRKDQPKKDKGVERKSKSSDQQNLGGPYRDRDTKLSGKEEPANDANDRGNNGRIIYLNSAARKEYLGDRPISSGERKRPFDRSFRLERSSRDSRDESCNERYQRVKRPDLRNSRSTGDRSFDPDYQLEPINSSTSARCSPDFSRRNPSHLPFQRRPPPFVRYPIKDLSPNRCIKRDIRDFVQSAHEENFMKNSSARSHYEQTRERRTFSPPIRRGMPLQLLPNCLRPVQHSPHQLSSCELMCFPQEIIHRRREEVPNDMRDMRDMRRFGMIERREIPEEEYFRVEDDEFVEDSRRGDDRRGSIRDLRDERESFHFRVEEGPGDFSARFRNQLEYRTRGNAEEQEENYRHRVEQEWRDSVDFDNNFRTKRRQF